MKPRKSLSLLVLPLLLTGCSTAQSELSSVDASADNQSSSSLESSLSASDFEEQVLYDYNDIKVIASNLINTDSMPTLEFTIENNSGNEIRVCTPNLSVNDCMMYTTFGVFVTVQPGETTTTGMYIPMHLLPGVSSKEIGKIEFTLELFGGEQEIEGYIPPLASLPVAIQLKDVEPPAEPEGELLLDEDGIRVISRGIQFIGSDAEVGLYIENTTDQPIAFSGHDLKVNGIVMTSGFMSCLVMPGKKAFTGIPIDSTVLLDNGKNTLETADFGLKVLDYDNTQNVLASTEVHLDLQK